MLFTYDACSPIVMACSRRNVPKDLALEILSRIVDFEIYLKTIRKIEHDTARELDAICLDLCHPLDVRNTS